jgi:hypothetical protein
VFWGPSGLFNFTGPGNTVHKDHRSRPSTPRCIEVAFGFTSLTRK